ncbi:helix-turn-helix domain-containing protein [Nonomuraea jiangxiensis]|uniref:helix-turn-helix domain-containing protein n=1 Tax=Nonomuraea jiangxiensis TaxID=633440 RepID=UPI000B87AADD|nr:helix-turn-helix transcriptional regulator [Nonomuraea jiangxiensis]
MPPRPQTPTVRMRRLARELRQLRENVGLSREEVGEMTEMNRATLYRIETAQVRPQVRTLRALMGVYRVAEDRQAELLAMLKTAHEQGWWQAAAELPEQYATYIGFEEEAQRVLNYESLFLPGMLQTEEYARAVTVGTGPTLPENEVEHRVVARMRRQARRDPPLAIWAIIDEGALHRQVGGVGVMHAQLQHLLDVSKDPNVTLQVVPFSAGAHPGMRGSFAILQFPEEHHLDIVYIETSTGDLFLESQEDVARYSLEFEHLRAMSHSPDATRDLIAEVLSTMK